MENKKLLLIDGHSILNRAYYGVPDFTNSEGFHTNAVFGFLNILFKVLEDEKPSHLAVAFDLSAPTFRHKMFDDYKGTRKPTPSEFKEQVPLIKEVLNAMNITVCELEGYEADDVLGTMSKKGEQEGFEVTVLSGDRDLLQLASSKIKISIPKTKKGVTDTENYYEDDVKELMKVTPTEFIDVKAIMGDTSDNIPGVKGIGEKGATDIILKFGSIENAYEHIDELANKRNRKLFVDDYDSAVLSKKLATIDTSAPVNTKISDCELKDIFTNEALAMIKKLEFKSMISKFEKTETEYKLSLEYKTTDDFEETVDIFDRCVREDAVGVCILSSENTFFGISVAFENEIVFIENSGFINKGFICDNLKKLKDTDIAVLDLKEKMEFFYDDTLSEMQTNIYDISIMAYLLNPLKGSYDYDDIAKDYLNELVPSLAEIFPKTKKEDVYKLDFDEPENREKFAMFACYNAYCMKRLFGILNEKLDETGMKKLYSDIEMPLIYALYDMQKQGVRVKKDELIKYGETLTKKADEIQKEIYGEVGEEFNINSPKQLGVILFEKLKLPYAKKKKTGYSTSADVLDKLKDDYPVVRKILQYRQITKLNSTYAQGLTAYIKEDGRIHGKFNQTITATGRISSTEPNLQNIPIRMELGREIRRVFVPKDGFVFIDADYSQIELRILAHMSADMNLINSYRESVDIHRATAAKVFNVPIEEVTKEMRSNAKAVNFGIIYGISAHGLSEDLSISNKQAKEYIEDYFKIYPKVKEYLDSTVENAKQNGYTTTLFGRRRPIPELKSSNFMQRQFGERAAMNSPIQGTAADIMKIAAVSVYKRLLKENLESKIVLQVHDELLVEAKADEVETVKKIMVEEMKNAANLLVPLEVEVSEGSNWFEAH